MENMTQSDINELPWINEARMTEEMQQRLFHNIRFLSFEKGETIFKQDSFISHIIFIKDGLAKMYIEGSSGKNITLKFIKSEEFIGLSILFNYNYYPYTVSALKKVEAYLIEINIFREIVQQSNCLSFNLINWFSDDSNFIYNKIKILGTKQLHGRLAEAILYLNQPGFEGEEIYNFITRKDMAELSGMSVESMIRLLNEFKEDKLIHIKGKKISINAMDMLLKLSQAG
jgi:CRP/FNR family transcriptional regulator